MRTDAIPEMKTNGLILRYNSNSIETDQDYDMSMEQSKKKEYTYPTILLIPL